MTVSGVGRGLTAFREGIGIALDSLRANKTRAALTILGVTIGVAVVVAMAATVDGINSSLEESIRSSGPTTFYVVRYFSGGVMVDDGSEENQPWRRNPPLTVEEAAALRQLPSIGAVTVREGTNTAMDAGEVHVSSVEVVGMSARYIEAMGGDIAPGRSWTSLEDAAGERVVVLNEKLAGRLFGPRRYPVGLKVRMSGQQYTVIGIYVPPTSFFGGGDQSIALLPHETLRRNFHYWRGQMMFLVRPVESVTMQQGMDDVTAALRRVRGLRPGQETNFSLLTQDAILNIWSKLTAVFFAVMIGLSSVGLMVGGVGVIAIMMISVTERTREIGVRKALGATRREILWQFLVEAATLTVIGGAIGLAIGGGGAWLLQHFTPVPARVPMWSVVVALLASALTGIVFGLVPANKASRMDPVEALRYE
jgi:putative ABC transport system permease protein